jgi:hypothetical protein
MNPRLHELVALAALAALGCGLALAVGDFGSPLSLEPPVQ